MIYILKEILASGRTLSEIGGVIKGGMNSLLGPLAEYIRQKGGEIRLNTPVESVAFEKGRACGVNIEQEEKLFFRDLSEQILEDDHISRLMTFPNVLITAHQAFFTREALTQIASTTLANLEAYKHSPDEMNEISYSESA